MGRRWGGRGRGETLSFSLSLSCTDQGRTYMHTHNGHTLYYYVLWSADVFDEDRSTRLPLAKVTYCTPRAVSTTLTQKCCCTCTQEETYSCVYTYNRTLYSTCYAGQAGSQGRVGETEGGRAGGVEGRLVVCSHCRTTQSQYVARRRRVRACSLLWGWGWGGGGGWGAHFPPPARSVCCSDVADDPYLPDSQYSLMCVCSAWCVCV